MVLNPVRVQVGKKARGVALEQLPENCGAGEAASLPYDRLDLRPVCHAKRKGTGEEKAYASSHLVVTDKGAQE